MILAAQALGETAGPVIFSRFVGPRRRLRLIGPLAVATCGVLALLVWRPGLPVTLLILFASGLAQGGMSLGQGTVMILAGAAADHHSPARVIALCGAAGAVLALVIAASWARDHGRRVTGRHQRPPGLSPLLAAHGINSFLYVLGWIL